MLRPIIQRTALFLGLLLICSAAACVNEPATNTNAGPSPSPSPSVSPTATSSTVPVTLPVLDAMFSDESFKTKLKSTAQLTDDQVAQLQKIASDEVARLRQSNLEGDTAEQAIEAEKSRQNATQAIRGVVGEQKAEAVFSFVREYWVSGGEEVADKADDAPAAPNAVPKDTRVVVNIPAYRMDVFRDGSLVKSYKVGIGYPDFPLPTGLRKAQSIIFNPTWTPPDEPWVAKMKGVAVGEKVEAGSKLNPLGPIKIPIGLPSLIHGGKSPAKLGTFASHGCVGLTTPQVQDFSKLLADVGGAELSDQQLQTYLKDRTKTQNLKLDRPVPVELRYETIVVEDGKLHIYRDVYANNTNTEENLRAVLTANGIKFEDLTEEERTQVLDAINAMSLRPQATTAASKQTPAASPDETLKKETVKTPVKKAKPIGKNQKEVVIEIAALRGKGYPVAVNFDTGSGKPSALVASNRPVK